VDIVEAEEAIRIIMMKMAEKGNQIIVVEEEEDILIGTTTTTTVKEELSTEEVIEVVAVQIITKHLTIPKLSETREKNK
jgi:hypothetical protein